MVHSRHFGVAVADSSLWLEPRVATLVSMTGPFNKTFDVAGAAGAGAASTARKRPLLGGARAAMSPTKRAVMTLLARARAATHKHAPAWPAPHE